MVVVVVVVAGGVEVVSAAPETLATGSTKKNQTASRGGSG